MLKPRYLKENAYISLYPCLGSRAGVIDFLNRTLHGVQDFLSATQEKAYSPELFLLPTSNKELPEIRQLLPKQRNWVIKAKQVYPTLLKVDGHVLW